MTMLPRPFFPRRLSVLFAALLLAAAANLPASNPAVAQSETAVAATSPAAFDDPQPVFAPTPRDAVFGKAVPRGVADLQAIQKQVQSIVEHLRRCTVGVINGRAAGSGVIVSKDGYVLTAAHVCRAPGRNVTIILADGRRLKGKTLGMYRTVDAGLMKITEKGEWPFARMADSTKLTVGDWCLATGHPGGFQKDRGSVLRLGRVILNRSGVIQSDCTLVGGDSGGPLFDIEGNVIGINSRIGESTSWNFHVPVSQYTDHWERLAAAEAWGGTRQVRRAVLGVNGEDNEQGCRVTEVVEGLPAEKAGLQAGDIILKLDGTPIKGIADLAERIGRKAPGETVKLQILRGKETLEKTATLARPE